MFVDWIWRNTKLLNCNCRNIVLLDCFWEIMCSLIAFVAILFSLLARSRPDPDVRQGDKMKKKWLFFSLWNCGQDPEWILFHFSLAWVIYRKDCKGYYHVSDLESLFRLIWLLFPLHTFYRFNRWWKHKYVCGGKGNYLISTCSNARVSPERHILQGTLLVLDLYSLTCQLRSISVGWWGYLYLFNRYLNVYLLKCF